MLIVDTGPLVAYFDANDQHHAWAVEQFQLNPAPFVTCEAVVAETDHLLEKARAPKNVLFETLLSGALQIDFCITEHLKTLDRLRSVYQSVPMSVADACLVRMAELSDSATVITLDSDFRLYRKNRRHVIPLICPF
ncbi:MAG TPA: PIN domain-containing protein [Verrucomicrobiae bacterium]